LGSTLHTSSKADSISACEQTMETRILSRQFDEDRTGVTQETNFFI
jgi:hypothetical protein